MLDGLGAALGKPDWESADIPPMSKEMFDRYVSLIGGENIQWITMAETQHAGSTYYRGQHLISPEGMVRIRAYAASLEHAAIDAALAEDEG